MLAYERRHEGERLLVCLSFGHQPHTFRLPDNAGSGRVLLSTRLDWEDETVGPEVNLRPDEGLIISL